MTDEEFLAKVRADNLAAMQRGVEMGWWESVNEKGDPVPFAKVFRKSDFAAHMTMAHVVEAAGWFTSASDAKRNGWNRPIELGEFWAFKKTKRIRIEA